MKKSLIFTIFIVVIAGYSDINGQDLKKFINNRKGTAEETTEKRVGKEADKVVVKEVNKALDKIFGKEEQAATAKPAAKDTLTEAEYSVTDTPANDEESFTEGSGSNAYSGDAGSAMTQKALLNSMGFTTGNANVKPVYEFDGFIEMTIQELNDNSKEGENTVYKTLVDSKSFDYCMVLNEKTDRSMIIFDTENSLMLTLGDSNGEKTGFAVNFKQGQSEAIVDDMGDEVKDPYSAYKTGKTKKILGYKCEEYVIEDDYRITTMWITNELDKELKKSYMQNSNFAGLFTYANNTNGFVMEDISVNKSDKGKTIMTVTDIDLNKKSTISTVGYNIMSMGAAME